MAQGRRPTPTSVLDARGSWRGKARRKAGEPQVPVEAPICPDWLGEEARIIWQAITPMLLSMRVLSRIDAGALARYCDAFVKWRKAALALDKMDLVYPLRNTRGEIVGVAPYPQHAIYDRYAGILDKLEQSFGLTPSARARVLAIETAHQEVESQGRLLKLLPSVG